ncbi:GNAT family N-acetyltransferase [Roseiterribacter gracilis]
MITPTSITIAPLTLPDARVTSLVAMSLEEGFDFLDRLDADWANGDNRFDARGEILLGVSDGANLIAVGGVNIDPYSTEDCGRLRRVYVAPSHRTNGVGALLVTRLLDHARENFRIARLRTDTDRAARFYERLGFRRIEDPNATHELSLV